MEPTRLAYPLGPEDEFAMSRFLVEAYGRGARHKYPARWKWLYTDSGAESLVVRSGDRLIAHVGCIPFEARAFGERIRGIWTVDTYVLPEARRRGYGTRMHTLAQSLRPLVLSAWLTQGGQKLKAAIGHTTLTELWVMRRRAGSSPVSHYDFGEPSASVIAEVAGQYLSRWDFYMDRTAAYCSWRFREQPLAEYRQVTSDDGVALVRRCGPARNGEGMIGDAFPSAPETSTAVQLVEAAARSLADLGCETVRFATTDAAVKQRLGDSGWQPAETLRLRGPVGTSFPKTFLSLSDQDMDQYPW